MAEGSKFVVLAALSGNLAIAATKFAAFAITRSTAMLTEAIHSVVDTGDQLLLLVGLSRGKRPADESHPFGYGMETYFWSFIVALMIFAVGGAVSIWEGVSRIRAPEPLERPWVNYLVLAISAVFEGASFAVSWREYRRIVGERPVSLWTFLRRSKDPSLFSTLMEDGAALAGLTIAAIGVTASSVLGLAWADGAASILIGLLLIGVAGFLANETRSLIAGEAAVPVIRDHARRALQDPEVERVPSVSSLHLGPESILVAAKLVFRRGVSGQVMEETLKRLDQRIREADPRIRYVYLQPDAGSSSAPTSPRATAASGAD